ncbi:hypothetical protein BASA50_008154 [Batrachochytrium salamandrivorans]|uniref:Uncharacterized protein n=1 Tax=Batrachochytrium salamandrivorans TaxID=1357716 RepID=A0ABQ8F7W1_9FUNG|nr:hypothetical protein BASA61_007968 [Batrachochytrium salamandrivorans]KAH6592253.1 hypothetical protein BASA50_008154 [Batrachochytrium salamandrivorans]KAH9253109.1 hypothetical protein BASA81_008943 [Batrachochytrium salamandrivorans]
MRVNILVVAAMVITSVNAGLIKESKDLSNDDLNLESVQSKEEWDIFQESEPTKNGQYDDSDDAEKTKICSALISVSEELHKDITDQASKFQGNLLFFYALKDMENNLEPEVREGHAEFYSQVKDEQNAIKETISDLERKYEEVWEKIVKTECPTESVHLLSPEDMAIGISLDKQMMTPQVQDTVESDVDILDKQ